MKSRILMSMLVIALAAALVGGATMAIFTAQDDTGSRTYSAGTVAVRGAGIEFVSGPEIGNMAPGDTVEGIFEVENRGSLDLWFTVEAIAEGELFEGIHPEHHNRAYVEIDSPKVILQQGEKATVGFSVTLPLDAGNVYQGANGQLKFRVNAEQAANNLPPWVEVKELSVAALYYDPNKPSDMEGLVSYSNGQATITLPAPVSEENNYSIGSSGRLHYGNTYFNYAPSLADPQGAFVPILVKLDDIVPEGGVLEKVIIDEVERSPATYGTPYNYTNIRIAENTAENTSEATVEDWFLTEERDVFVQFVVNTSEGSVIVYELNISVIHDWD